MTFRGVFLGLFRRVLLRTIPGDGQALGCSYCLGVHSGCVILVLAKGEDDYRCGLFVEILCAHALPYFCVDFLPAVIGRGRRGSVRVA